MITYLFLSVFEISVSTSLIVLVLLMLAKFLNRRYAAKWNYYIWIALAFRLLIPLNITIPLRQIVINVPTQIVSPIVSNVKTAIPITLQSKQTFIGITILDIIAILWLIGSMLFLFIHIFSFLYYKLQIAKKGTAVKNELILSQLLGLQKDLQIKTKISIIEYYAATSPMIIGFFRPFLVLPENEYSQEELFFILKHELIHLKHHDIYFKLLFVITNAMHWFNPLIYVMQKEAMVDMELSCDERVIQGTTYAVRKAYTETLLSTLHKQYKKTALTTQFYGGTQIMKKRFTNILLKSKKKNGFFILLCAISMTLILGMITGCSIQDTIPSEVQTSTETPNKNPVDNTTAQAASTQIQKSEQDNTKNSDETLSRDGQEIKKIVEEFAAAYFDGDTDIIQSYLTTPYEWDIDIYNGTGTISDLTLKGLTDIGEKETGSTQVVSLEYRDSNDTDSLQYLSMEFIKQVHGWKIQFYGIES